MPGLLPEAVPWRWCDIRRTRCRGSLTLPHDRFRTPDQSHRVQIFGGAVPEQKMDTVVILLRGSFGCDRLISPQFARQSEAVEVLTLGKRPQDS